MARSRTVSVPGAGDSAAAAPAAANTKRSTRKPAATAAADPNGVAEAAQLPPKIREAEESATHMSVEKARELDANGALGERVLTPEGWYIPKSTEEVG